MERSDFQRIHLLLAVHPTDLNGFQKKANELVEKIDGKYMGSHDDDTVILHLAEELGEVARQVLNRKLGRAELDKGNLAEEICDCMMLPSRLAHNDIELEDAVLAKFQELKQKHKLKD